MKKIVKTILIAAAMTACMGLKAHALIGAFVQITTGTLQPGTTNGFNVSSGTVVSFNVTGGATMTVIGMPTSLASAPAFHNKSQATTGIAFQSSAIIFSVAGSSFVVIDATGLRQTSGNLLAGAAILGGTGATGTHQSGELRIFPTSASKGFLSFLASDNTGNTTTQETWAAHGGARTYTHVDFGASGNYAMSTSTGPRYLLQPPVQCSISASSSTSSTNFANTTLTCSITPTQTTSQIRISVSGELASNSGTAGTTTAATVARGVTNLFGTSGFAVAEAPTAGVTVGMYPASLSGYYDSPATTSSTTYTLQIKVLSGTTTAVWCQTNETCRMTLEEIGQ